jgi:NTE family protein
MDIGSPGGSHRASPWTPAEVAHGDGPWRPEACACVSLVLQGGGALGAYQAGVYEALHEAGLEPDWVAGVSIGAINGAIIAGNPREKRVERLRQFWETITARSVSWFPGYDDASRTALGAWSSLVTTTLGQPGFFTPNVPNPWLSTPGSPTATSFYNTAPLIATLSELVDFDQLNDGPIRYAAGAVDVRTGNFQYFDRQELRIGVEHVLASGALPPALPMVEIGTDWYWDGGLVSNTPLQHVLERGGSLDQLIFQVDLFSAVGPLPRTMLDVLGREKDIRYSSRTRLVTDQIASDHKRNQILKQVLDKVPEHLLSPEEAELKEALRDHAEITLLHLIYRQEAYEGQAKDYEFSGESMRVHWRSGYRDAKTTLSHREWLKMPPDDGGILVHDVHRPNG